MITKESKKPKKKAVKTTVKKKAKTQKRSLSLKQRAVLENTLENPGKPKGRIIKEAGYSDAMAKNPKDVYESKGLAEAFGKIFTDEYLIKKHKEIINARKIEVKDFFSYQWEDYDADPEHVTEQIAYDLESDMPGSKVVTIRKAGNERNQYLSVRFSMPDYGVQDRSLDKAYKVKGAYAPEKKQLSGRLSLSSLFSDTEVQEEEEEEEE